MLNKSEIYMDNSINKKAVKEFFCRNSHTEIHTVKIVNNGKTMLRIAPKPYSCRDCMQVYSLSKSFSGTAIGILCTDGVLSVEDYICDIFSDRIPKEHSKNLDKLQVKHLLSMNVGHENSALEQSIGSEDILSDMLSKEIKFNPSEHFAYNNGASYILSEIVTKYSGMSLFDFLYLRLFKPLGMNIKKWDSYKNGISQGAIGLYINIDDIAKLGQLYLNGGMWRSERILSEEWVKNASKKQSDNSGNGTADWSSGYGYQLWINHIEGYRGDGAVGQLMIVLPNKNMVVAVQALTNDMQKEMDFVLKLVNEMNCESSDIDVSDNVDSYYPIRKCDTHILKKYCGTYVCEENNSGITLAEVKINKDNAVFSFSDGKKLQNMYFGIEKWSKSNVSIKNFRPTLESLVEPNIENDIVFASHCYTENNKLCAYIKFLDCPHNITLKFDIIENEITVYKDEKRFLKMKKVNMN